MDLFDFITKKGMLEEEVRTFLFPPRVGSRECIFLFSLS